MNVQPDRPIQRIPRSLRGQVPPSLIHKALVDRRWHPVAPWRSADTPFGPLPTDLRSWPARWRYRVADLELAGVSRKAAVRTARREAAEDAAHTA